MTNVKLYDNCDGFSRDACYLCLCSSTIADDWEITEIADPTGNSDAGTIRMYAKGNSIWIKDEAGTTTDIGTVTGGGASLWEAGASGWLCPVGTCDTCMSILCSCGVAQANFVCGGGILINNDRVCSPTSCILIRMDCGGLGCTCIDTPYLACFGASGVHWLRTCSYAYTNPSDKRLKCDYQQVDCQDILQRYESIPMNSWNWKGDETKEKNIGFTAQDFQQTFGDVITISCEGLNLSDQIGMRGAAIQALITRVKELEEKVRRKKNEKKRKELSNTT